jgi:hypothetical protein
MAGIAVERGASLLQRRRPVGSKTRADVVGSSVPSLGAAPHLQKAACMLKMRD